MPDKLIKIKASDGTVKEVTEAEKKRIFTKFRKDLALSNTEAKKKWVLTWEIVKEQVQTQEVVKEGK